MTTRQHTCLTCGEAITVTARNPNRRYCSPRCRVADWHRHNDRPPADPPTDVDDVHDVHDVPNPVPDAVPGTGTPSPNAVPDRANTANGDQRCPHCRQPVAVIAVLVPPTAAHVRTPEAITMTPG